MSGASSADLSIVAHGGVLVSNSASSACLGRGMPEGADSWTAWGWPGAHMRRAWAMPAGHRPCSCWGRGSCPLRRSQRRPAAHGSRPKVTMGVHPTPGNVGPQMRMRPTGDLPGTRTVCGSTPQQHPGYRQGHGSYSRAGLAACLASRKPPRSAPYLHPVGELLPMQGHDTESTAGLAACLASRGAAAQRASPAPSRRDPPPPHCSGAGGRSRRRLRQWRARPHPPWTP